MKLLTPDAASRELARVLHVVRREREKLADHVKEARGRIAALEERARELVDIATGRAGIQVELDTEAPGPGETEPEALTEPPPPPKKKGKKRKPVDGENEAEEIRACALAFADENGPPWLAKLLAKPGAPLFVPGEWWPEVGSDGKLMHGSKNGKCPDHMKDWRDCPTCLAEASAGPEARQ